MEPWGYIPEEKSYLFSDEMDYSLDAFMRTRKTLVEWDNKASCNFERDGFNSEKGAVKNMEFVDLGFPDLFRKPSHGSQPMETSSCELDGNSSRRGNSPTHVIALDSSFGEEVSESEHLSALFETKTYNSSLIDLKLGRLADCQGASSDAIRKEGFTITPMHPTTSLVKRSRTSSSLTQTPVCQVYGCNMDLSSSKDYHKRHKVCDVHSKTAKVIVNGIEQRFCQQCSRFHLLAEFDDGKRSCRRRLAGHNERRRKPQFDYMSGKQHKILQSYQGAKYMGSSLQKRPQFSFQDIFRSGILFPAKYDQTSESGHIKLEEESILNPQLAAAPITQGQDLSSCALSLLSAKSQILSSRHTAENPFTSLHVLQDIYLHSEDDQVSETPSGISNVNRYVSDESFPCGTNSRQAIQNEATILSEAGHAHHVQGDDVCQPPDIFNVKHDRPSEHGATVDLFQLSSHLQRVEQQRNSVLVKWENEDCCFSTL